jgi:hypothetical protein
MGRARVVLGDVCRTWSKLERQRAQLERWSAQLLGIPFGARGELTKPTTPLPLVVSDDLRRSVAVYLRRLARSPAALEALSGERRRGRPPGTQRDYRIATDYEATRELHGKGRFADALIEVGEAWGIGRTAILDAHKRYRDEARSEIRRLARANPDMDREALLTAISDALRSPGN